MTLRDPIVAVTHPDPYAYYADLVARTPLYWDETSGLWVAASAAAVTAVLTSECCRVRPPAEPVPAALLGTPAGDIFGRLVRMNDGPDHRPLKRAITTTLGDIDGTRVAGKSRAWARVLAREITPEDQSTVWDFAFRLPVYVVASLLGAPRDHLRQTSIWMGEFARCLAPASTPAQIRRGAAAATGLLDLFHPLLATQSDGRADGLLVTLAREAARVGRDDPDAIVANGIGFLFQAYEATAGLIGNTLVALAADRAARDAVVADPGLLRDVISEVLRHDPPVQNTRRFLARDAVIAGREMARGDGVLVVLAAANRDPAANPFPHRFDIGRKDRQTFTFGRGAHTCPGDTLARIIVQAGIAQVIASGVDLARLTAGMTYRESVNARIPLFARAMTT
jgi:cytochrome P450